MSVVLDLQGAQSVDHRDRGIARYVVDLAKSLEEIAPGFVDAYTYNPDLALPGGIETVVSSGRFYASDEVDYEPGTVLHVASPIELAVPFERVVPQRARDNGCRIVVTLFDLIPEVFADQYLVQPGIRRRYRTRLELVRTADAVIAISRSTADDGKRLLAIPDERMSVVELAAGSRFVPATDRAVAAAIARDALPGLGKRFVLYTGGQDPRKNLEGLLDAWALVQARDRAAHELVVACSLEPLAQNHIEVRAAQLGVGDSVLVTGFVPDDVLVALNQSASLVVFPSLYEGFGLPVVEALACGTPAVASNRSSLPELLPPEATFNPDDAQAIASAIERGLHDESLRAQIVASYRPRSPIDIAVGTVAVYERVSGALNSKSRVRRAQDRRMRVAFVSPLPPVPGGVSDFSYRLLEHLATHADVDAFVDAPPHHRGEALAAVAPPGVGVHQLATLGIREAVRGAYDRVVWTLGNSEYHTGALDGVLRRRAGVVLAHEVRLTGLHRFARWQHPQATPDGFAATLHRLYDGKLPESLGDDEQLEPSDAERYGVFMARGAIEASDAFLVTSTFAARLALLDARREDRDRVDVVPFVVGAVAGDPWPTRGAEDPAPLVVSFGGISELKQTTLLVEAFALIQARDVRLVFVGAVNDDVRRTVDDAATRAGVRGRVEVTGTVDADEYRSWLSRAWVAVQLRATTNGESSGAAGDCFAAGVPTIVTAIGAAREIPQGAAVGVPADVSPPALATAIDALLSDTHRRAALSAGALAHAANHTYAAAAAALYEKLAAL